MGWRDYAVAALTTMDELEPTVIEYSDEEMQVEILMLIHQEIALDSNVNHAQRFAKACEIMRYHRQGDYRALTEAVRSIRILMTPEGSIKDSAIRRSRVPFSAEERRHENVKGTVGRENLSIGESE